MNRKYKKLRIDLFDEVWNGAVINFNINNTYSGVLTITAKNFQILIFQLSRMVFSMLFLIHDQSFNFKNRITSNIQSPEFFR